MTETVQGVNNLLAEDEKLVIQPVKKLPADNTGGKPLPVSGQVADPQVVQVVPEKNFFISDELASPQPGISRGYSSPSISRPRSTLRRPAETPAPETLPLTDELRLWAADTVPGLPLEQERDKFVCYARAHGLTHVDWSEALKLWWLEAHARALRRGELQRPAAARPAPEPPPLYDTALHAQMQADVARLCGTIGPSIAGTNDHQQPHRRHTLPMLRAEGLARERDPAYLAQIRARKAVLQAQAARLRAQELCLDAVGAAD